MNDLSMLWWVLFANDIVKKQNTKAAPLITWRDPRILLPGEFEFRRDKHRFDTEATDKGFMWWEENWAFIGLVKHQAYDSHKVEWYYG